MRTFHFYVDDARSDDPRELVVQTRDHLRAREMAEKMQAESEHHRGVEVCEKGSRLFGLGSFAARSWCERQMRDLARGLAGPAFRETLAPRPSPR